MKEETTVLQLDQQKSIANFTFEKLNLKVKIAKNEEKVLLKEISGGVKAGELVAIMGG